MQEQLINTGVKPEPDVFSRRTMRIHTLQGANGNLIGFYEVQIYDSLGRNLCRTAGFTPTVKFSGPGTVSAPPENTINGIFSGSWQDTCYVPTQADASRYLQYTFPQEIAPTRLQIMFEGVYVPAGNAIRISFFVGNTWRTMPYSINPTSWQAGNWQVLTLTGTLP